MDFASRRKLACNSSVEMTILLILLVVSLPGVVDDDDA